VRQKLCDKIGRAIVRRDERADADVIVGRHAESVPRTTLAEYEP
jgi:hypothetical protein